MEWKIGEIRQVNGEWYQCVEGNGCENCAFKGRKCYLEGDTDDPIGECCYDRRRDNKDVIFKKLEKVGEPYVGNNGTFQSYKLAMPIYGDIPDQIIGFTTTEVVIKQTKEDMEEKKVKISRGNADYLISKLQDILADHLHGGESDEVIAEFEKFIDASEKLSENIEKNLKPFSLELAKQGKPVCTRDGRKARIICFDANGSNSQQIIALITDENGFESSYSFTNEGRWTKEVESVHDLMMLPEKKEGWVNLWRHESGTVHPDGNVYSSKEEAVKIGSRDYNYVDTVKIEWEE